METVARLIDSAPWLPGPKTRAWLRRQPEKVVRDYLATLHGSTPAPQPSASAIYQHRRETVAALRAGTAPPELEPAQRAAPVAALSAEAIYASRREAVAALTAQGSATPAPAPAAEKPWTHADVYAARRKAMNATPAPRAFAPALIDEETDDAEEATA